MTKAMYPDRSLLTTAMLLQAIALDVERARRHLDAERQHLDGMPTTASGAATESRGERTIAVRLLDDDGEPLRDETGQPIIDRVPATPVETAALNRERIEEIRADLEAHVRGVVTIVNEIARTTQRILATRIEVPRCTSKTRDGAIEWGDPTCLNVPSRGPLCDRCAKAEYRWRTARGLPPRTNTVYSADGAA